MLIGPNSGPNYIQTIPSVWELQRIHDSNASMLSLRSIHIRSPSRLS
jgi:hypothetical protein